MQKQLFTMHHASMTQF